MLADAGGTDAEARERAVRQREHGSCSAGRRSSPLAIARSTLDEAIVHLEQPLAGVLADNFIAGLKRRAFAGDVRLRLTDSFAV